MKYFLITHGNTGQVFLGRADTDNRMLAIMREFCEAYGLEQEFEILVSDNDPSFLVSGSDKIHWDKWLNSASYPIINVTHRA